MMMKSVMVAAAILPVVSFGRICDDALVWREGADALDPEQKYGRVEEDVVSPWNGLTNRLSVLRMNQSVNESLSVPTSLTTNITMMTLHMRCKWDGTFVTGTQYERAYLFSYGSGWNQYRGSSFSFIPLASGSASIRFDNGRNQAPQTSPGVSTNAWYDVFLTVKDPQPDSTAGHNVYIHCYLFKDRCTWTEVNISGIWPSWRSGTGDYRSAVLNAGESITFASQFRGSIARAGFWNRELTKSEMAALSTWPNDEGRTLRVEGTELNETTPELQVTFEEKGHGVYENNNTETYAYVQTLPNVLTVKTLPDSGICEVEAVLDEGTPNERGLKSPTLYPGEATQVYVRELPVGTHELTIRRKRGTVKLDFVELSGSWSIGDYSFGIFNNWKNYSGGLLCPYVIGTHTPTYLLAGLAKEGALGDDQYTTLIFNLTPEMARPGYRFDIATGQAMDNKAANFVVYVNGVEFCRTVAPHDKGNLSVSFPPNTFQAGDNRIALRFDASKHVSGYWINLRGFRLVVQKEGLPKYGSTMILK